MGKKDYQPVIVYRDDVQREVYGDIAASFSGLESIFIREDTDVEDYRELIARQVADVIGDMPSLLIAQKHYPMAFCYDGVPAVIFDAHNDSYWFEDSPYFHDGDFLLYRKGECIILGTNITSITSLQERIKTYSAKFLKNKCVKVPSKAFISFEIDVLDSESTIAMDPLYLENKVDVLIARISRIRGRINWDDSMRITKEILADTEPIGINLAGYIPQNDRPGLPTADMLKEYLTLFK